MQQDPRHWQRRRRDGAVPLPLGFAPQVLPALQIAECLTVRIDCRRHEGRSDRR